MFKYPPLIDDEKRVITSIKIPERFREMVGKLGNENFNAGINIILYTIEDRIVKHLEKKSKKNHKEVK
jgi:hypothetical protein